MSPKEEELERRKKLLGDYILASHKELDEKLQAINDLSVSLGNFFGALHKLGESNEKLMLDYRAVYQKFFLDQLEVKKDYRSQLEFISEQIRDLHLKIAEAKATRHELYQKIYEDTLRDVVLPFKVELMDMVRLENEVGKLKKEVASPAVVEFHQTHEYPVNQIIHGTKNIPVSETTEARMEEDVLKEFEQPKESEEIVIPVTLTDKPLETKSGKKLNNEEYIAGIRKFIWTDERIPGLIGDFLLGRKCIPESQHKTVQEFFKTGRSNSKIVFNGKANQLTTMFYELRKKKYLKVSIEFLGERIEAVFIRKGYPDKPFIKKSSLKSGCEINF